MTGNISNDMGVLSVPDAIAGVRVLMSMTVRSPALRNNLIDFDYCGIKNASFVRLVFLFLSIHLAAISWWLIT
jgi:hypothetical protein